jgi:hypothetical protein
MNNEKDEDVIIIHLGRVLSEEQFSEVEKSIVAFMNKRWPDLQPNRFSN